MSSAPPRSPVPLPGAERLRLNAALIDRVRTRLATPPVRIDMQAILAALRAEGCMLDGRELRAAAYQVRSELTGAGVWTATWPIRRSPTSWSTRRTRCGSSGPGR